MMKRCVAAEPLAGAAAAVGDPLRPHFATLHGGPQLPPPPAPLFAPTQRLSEPRALHGMEAAPADDPRVPIKMEVPAVPHLYPSQHLFPRESSTTAMDAMIGLKTLATHAGAQVPLRSLRPLQQHLQLPENPQRMQSGYELPSLIAPPRSQQLQHPRKSQSERFARLSPPPRRTAGEQAVKTEGDSFQPPLLPPPLIIRHGDPDSAADRFATQNEGYFSGDVDSPGLAALQSAAPLAALLGRKNKRGEPRAFDDAKSPRSVWEEASRGRLDPTASPPRPTAAPHRIVPVVAAPSWPSRSLADLPSDSVTTIKVPSLTRTGSHSGSTPPESAPIDAHKQPTLTRRVSASRWRHELTSRDRAKTRERIQRGLHHQCEGDYEALALVLAAMEEELLHVRTTSSEHYFDQARELSTTIATAKLDE